MNGISGKGIAMNRTRGLVGKRLLIVTSALALFGLVPAAHAQAGVPPADAPGQTDLQAETHFLSFIGSFIGEDQTTSAAYYKAIGAVGTGVSACSNSVQPLCTKENVTDWLVNAGFIGKASDWHASGAQIIACDAGAANGCDMPAHDASGNLVYGDNIINADSHAIVLNAADLGFVRNQFIRCKPSCSAPNPLIYTYLENYPVDLFALTSGFPKNSGYPTQAEANAAIRSAINRPAGNCPASATAPGGGHCTPGKSLQRIADVMFEWVPPLSNPTSSTRFGTLYAYIVDPHNVNSETLRWPADLGGAINGRAFGQSPSAFPAISTKTGQPITFATGPSGDFFAPELDQRGFKQHPTVCLVCHGGQPTNLVNGQYPRGGNINGFRLLPLDVVNLNFSSDTGPDQPGVIVTSTGTHPSLAFTDRSHQESQIKEYNRVVLATVDQSAQNDGTGATRPPHLATVINGWYAPNFTATAQNSDFVPPGWTGFETLYKGTVGPSCRSCHFNREVSLDFGTVANFSQESDILQLALIQECKFQNGELDGNANFMPLAHLTYLRYWQTQATTESVNFGRLTLSHEPDTIADHFGLGNVNGYCATNP